MCVPATPNRRVSYDKKTGARTRRVTFLDWVEYDDRGISNQECPEKQYSDDRGKTGVSTN